MVPVAPGEYGESRLGVFAKTIVGCLMPHELALLEQKALCSFMATLTSTWPRWSGTTSIEHGCTKHHVAVVLIINKL